jgi:hypothetical protein
MQNDTNARRAWRGARTLWGTVFYVSDAISPKRSLPSAMFVAINL